MFTSTVLNHSVRSSNPLCGGLHLNALNGSSDVLGCNNGDQDRPQSENAFGGLFGVSLSDNHPYRPHDSGRSFIDSRDVSENKGESFQKKRNKEHLFKDVSLPSSVGRRHRYISRSDSRETDITSSPLSLRRHSLNIDADGISTHAQCGSDLSLSLEDISTPSTYDLAGQGQHVSRKRNDIRNPYLDFARLSITQVDFETTDPCASSVKNGHNNGRKNRLRSHTADSGGSDKAMKILDKIKEGKKGDQSKSKTKNPSSLVVEKSTRSSSTSRQSHAMPRDSHEVLASHSKRDTSAKHRGTHKNMGRHSLPLT